MRKWILWGLGEEGEAFYLSMCIRGQKHNIAGVIDTYKKGKFYDWSINGNLSEICNYSKTTHLIVVSTSWDVVVKIR